ncbi:Uu.00g071600.m01.CDS01 [Anthostomella pinea]|uniref:Uu.00g071600.m01.CDS01 n=1 Tax=Anthostomella pinea TaxID=933095 RepID=A0AAI8VVT1_9PEZI|nr:Uu.00g071600.m01.CDS01 [Anthostomella pinea]
MMLPSTSASVSGSSSTTHSRSRVADHPPPPAAHPHPGQHGYGYGYDAGRGPARPRSPSPHKRRLSLDYDAQSPDSNTSSRDNVSAAADEQRTKRRRTAPGSRGVANLTPEQLAKKRANDREAQRAIRERTKTQIETLEKRIHDLTSQQPYQELQAVIRQKEAVEAENAEIKGRLASIISLIQPILSNQQVEGAYASPVPTLVPFQSTVQPPPPSSHSAHNASTPVSVASPVSAVDSSWHSQGHSAQPSPGFNPKQLLNQQRHDLLHTLELGAGEQLKLDFLLDPSQRVNRIQAGPNGAQDTPGSRHLPMKHDWTAASLPPPRSSSAMSGVSRPHQQQQQQRIDYTPENTTTQSPRGAWVGDSATLKNTEPTCPLDNLLLDFLFERRQRAAEGVSPQEIVGPRYPSVSSLLNPANSAHSHPLSKVFTDILATFPGICTLPERVAVLYIMFLIMRWQISPTPENFGLLPSWAAPTPEQLATPHPAWIDHLPFPRMREKLTRDYNPHDYLFDDFFIPFTSTISLNWPYEGTDALLQSPDGAELLINPVFERHLRRLENWTLGDAFDRAFPKLRGTYNFKVDSRGSGSRSVTKEGVDERLGER